MSTASDRTPVPLEGVRIVRPDGTEIPCEVRYVGRQPDSCGGMLDVWRAVSEYVLDARAGDRLSIGMLPARTAITVAADTGGGVS